MKNLIYIILFFSILTNNVKAQYFNINLGRPKPYLEFSHSNPLVYHDSLWIINMNITRYATGNYTFFPSIITINNKGEFINEIFPTDTINKHYYAEWVKVSEKEYAVVGTEYDSSNVASFFLLKLDEKLHFISKTLYKVPRDIGDISGFKKLPNGNLAFCALIQNYDKVNKKFGEQQAVFYLLDSLGNKLWYSEYGDSTNNEKYHDFTWDKYYNFYLVGQWIEPYSDGDFQNLLVKIDSTGNIQWGKKYGKKEDLNGWTVIKFTNDNKLIYFGVYNAADIFQNYGGLELGILDTSGQVNSNKRYFNFPVQLNDCVQDNQGNFICDGQTSEPDDKNVSGFIAKINQNADTIWTRNYPLYIESVKKSQNYYAINKTGDGGYILTGITSKINNEGIGSNAQAWVMTVDSMGYDHLTQFPTATHEPESENENIFIKFYPNPTNGELFYRWNEIAPIVRDSWVVYFYDLQGNLVITHPMSFSNNSIMLQSLASGVYPYVIKDSKNAFIKSGKVVVQRRY